MERIELSAHLGARPSWPPPTARKYQKSSDPLEPQRHRGLLLPFCLSLRLCASVLRPLIFSQLLRQRTWVYLALLGVGLALPLSGVAGPLNISLEQYVRAFESSYHAVNTLRADFTQSYTSGGRTRVESGTVRLAKGGRMRWDYREPEAKVFVSDGKQLSLYIPAEKQVTRSGAKATEDFRTPLGVLLSRLSLRKVFSRVEFADQALHADAGNRVLRGYPKQEFEDEYREVLIELSPQMDIRRLVVLYADNSTMEFTFTNIRRNVDLQPSIFHLDLPPGVEVIQQ
jgi:outer membrane lipoprotein carrier protein